MEVSSLLLLRTSTQVAIRWQEPLPQPSPQTYLSFLCGLQGLKSSSLQGKHFYLLRYLDSPGHSILKL